MGWGWDERGVVRHGNTVFLPLVCTTLLLIFGVGKHCLLWGGKKTNKQTQDLPHIPKALDTPTFNITPCVAVHLEAISNHTQCVDFD